MSDLSTSTGNEDLSALAWVHDELRRSLEAAHKALRRFVKETESLAGTDLDAIDPVVLRTARAQIHQGVGALELVGQPAAAMVLRASESAVMRFVAKPHKLTNTAVDDLENASFALLDYLGRLLANKPVSTLSMFPQYRAVQEAAGADRVHPADLWASDWRWRELPSDPSANPQAADAAMQSALEAQLLPLMRAPDPTPIAARMSDLFASLGAGAQQAQTATLWKLAAAVFEAQAHRRLGFDVFSKRVASRLLAQLRSLERGESEVSERLAQDLLFFCAQSAAPALGEPTPRLAGVREVYGLAAYTPVDYSVSVLGRFDPAVIAQARKRVAAAKDAWSAVAGGEMHRMTGLSEQFALVGESLKKLFPLGDLFAAELQHAIAQTQTAHSAPPAPLAMEVATSLLYIEAALEDADFDHPDQAGRVQRLAERLAAVRTGQPPAPLEGWMEDLYRRVSDRQTMGSVVQELRTNLSESEKLIDQYFRNPADRQVLIPVPNQLATMRGVLSVLGMDHACAALLRMRDEVDELAVTAIDPKREQHTGVFDRLASNLGALGFLIDMLSVQPQMAKSLFAFDAESGMLNPVMGRGAVHAPPITPVPIVPAVEPRLIEQALQLAVNSASNEVPIGDVKRDLERLSLEAQAADQPALAATVAKAQQAIKRADDADDQAVARVELAEALSDFVATASEPVGLDAPPTGSEVRVGAERVSAPMKLDFAPSTTSATLAQDDEMREIFLEEAREVLTTATEAHAELAQAPEDLGMLTTLRRAFHTLKGSSRMVGLKEFGEAAWACEQLYNSQLAEQGAAPEALIEFTTWCLPYLSAWIDDISVKRAPTHDAATVIAAAQRVGKPAAKTEPAATKAEAPAPAPEVAAHPVLDLPPDLPSAADLVLHAPPRPSVPEPSLPPLSFELDLAQLDASIGATPADDADHVPSEHGSLDMATPALLSPFVSHDMQPTEPLPLAEIIDEPAASSALDLELDFSEAAPMVESLSDAGTLDVPLDLNAAAPAAPVAEAIEEPLHEEEHVKVVGPLRIGIPLFNIYLNEADELSRRLTTAVAEWAMELHRPIGEAPIALAHSLAGSSATVGFSDLSQLARSLEHAQTRSQAIGHGTADEARLFVDAAEEIRRLLHQFAAGFLKEPAPELLERLAAHELSSARRLEAAAAAAELAPLADAEPLHHEPVHVEPPHVEPLHAEPPHVEPLHAEPPHVEPPHVEPPHVEPPHVEPPHVEPPHHEPVHEEPPHHAPLPEPVWHEPPVQVEAPAPIAASEPEPLTVTDTAPRRFDERAEAGDSTYGTPTRFDAFGVTELKPLGDLPHEAPRHAAPSHEPIGDDEAIDAVDAIDADLFPIFNEEAEELLPQLGARLRDWAKKPGDPGHPAACMRTLHTLKGGARLAGAMRLGEMAHRLEARIERLLAEPPVLAAQVEALQTQGDALAQTLEALRSGKPLDDELPSERLHSRSAPLADAAPITGLAVLLESAPPEARDSVHASLGSTDVAPTPSKAIHAEPPQAEPPQAEPLHAEPAAEPLLDAAPPPVAEQAAPTATLPEIDWTRFATGDAATARGPVERAQATQSAVRVRAPLLDRLVNQAGEVSITRSRIETGVGQIKHSLADLTENLERLRAQLRDIEFHGETQMTSRLEAAKAASQSFDPLEFDRFTRFQELTRMMAESVNDVATVQRTLQRSLESTEDELVAQARMTRDLQDDLLRTRMVEFEGLSDRLYRVVRQAAKETGKSVRLDIVGGSIEVDRGVLDRMTGSFEHLLRNCVSHGVESPAAREAAGKDPTGTIIVALSQEANEVGVEFRDDGAGLNLARIRAKGEALGLIAPGAQASDAELANLIFSPGFSTADQITELSGRGIGMDVVRSEVNAMGGRVETATAAGQGTSFKLILPLTTAVTQVVMLRCGETQVAVPSTLVEIVRRASAQEIEAAYATASYTVAERALQFFWLGALLQISPRPAESANRTRTIVVIRSAQQRVALHVDEVLGNQEVVVKHLGPQLSRLPGLAGITLLASGTVALIYNPVALATLYGDAARAATQEAMHVPSTEAVVPTPRAADVSEAPLVMVVDDSLTVRRVTQRLLLREGYRVVLAKDGMDALERLAEAIPAIVLSDIEMPRMDGFDLVRNMRSDARLRDLPVIMITSRIAQKHREYAAELGVDHYLGKPYSEEDLLALIGRYTATHLPA